MFSTNDANSALDIEPISEDDEFRLTIRILLDCLKFGGLVNFDGRSLNFIGTHLLALYSHLCYLFVTVMFFWNLMTKIHQSQLDVDVIAEAVGVLGIHSRFLILFHRRRRLSNMLRCSEKLWCSSSPSEKETVQFFVKSSSRLCYCYLGCGIMICVMYLFESQIMPTSADGNETSTRKLPYAFFTDVQRTPWYEIVCAIQFLSMLSIGVTSTGVDTAASFLIMMTCGYFKSLQNRLLNISQLTEKEKDNVENMVLECARYHQTILK